MSIIKVLFNTADYIPILSTITNSYAVSKIDEVKKHTFKKSDDFNDFDLSLSDKSLSRCKWARIPLIGNLYALFDDIHIVVQQFFIRSNPETLKTKSFEFQKAFLRDEKTHKEYLKYASDDVLLHFVEKEKRLEDLKFVDESIKKEFLVKHPESFKQLEKTEQLKFLNELSAIKSEENMKTFAAYWNNASKDVQKDYLSKADINIIQILISKNLAAFSDLDPTTLLVFIEGDNEAKIQQNPILLKHLSNENQAKVLVEHPDWRENASPEAQLLMWTLMPQSKDGNDNYFEKNFLLLKEEFQNHVMKNAPENFNKLSMGGQKSFLSLTTPDVAAVLISVNPTRFDLMSTHSQNSFLDNVKNLPDSFLDKMFQEFNTCAQKKQAVSLKTYHQNLQWNLFCKAAEVLQDQENKITVMGLDREQSKTLALNFLQKGISAASKSIAGHVKKTYPQFFENVQNSQNI